MTLGLLIFPGRRVHGRTDEQTRLSATDSSLAEPCHELLAMDAALPGILKTLGVDQFLTSAQKK